MSAHTRSLHVRLQDKKKRGKNGPHIHFSRADARLAHMHLGKLSWQRRLPWRMSAHTGTSRPRARGPQLIAARWAGAGGPVRIWQRVLALVVFPGVVDPSCR